MGGGFGGTLKSVSGHAVASVDLKEKLGLETGVAVTCAFLCWTGWPTPVED